MTCKMIDTTCYLRECKLKTTMRYNYNIRKAKIQGANFTRFGNNVQEQKFLLPLVKGQKCQQPLRKTF